MTNEIASFYFNGFYENLKTTFLTCRWRHIKVERLYFCKKMLALKTNNGGSQNVQDKIDRIKKRMNCQNGYMKGAHE
jgi:hypothetical protein